MSTPAPGWYADPSDPRQNRYWDGAAWTEHVSPGFPHVGDTPAGSAPRRSLRWLWILLGVLAAVFVLIGGCAAVGLVTLRGAVDAAGTAINDSVNAADAATLPDGAYRIDSITAYVGFNGECAYTGPTVDAAGVPVGAYTVETAGARCEDGMDAVAVEFTVTGGQVTVTQVDVESGLQLPVVP